MTGRFAERGSSSLANDQVYWIPVSRIIGLFSPVGDSDLASTLSCTPLIRSSLGILLVFEDFTAISDRHACSLPPTDWYPEPLAGMLSPNGASKLYESLCVSSMVSLLLCIADWITQQPSAGTQWTNGQAYPVSWIKGVGDGVVMVDIEMSRLSQDGLILVARNG